MGGYQPFGHDLQRDQVISVHRRRPRLRPQAHQGRERSRRVVHAKGRGPVYVGAQCADHLGSHAASDQRLVRRAVGTSRTGRIGPAENGATPADWPKRPMRAAGHVLQVQRRPSERAVAGDALRDEEAAAGRAEGIDHGSDRRLELLALGAVRQRLRDDRRQADAFRARRRPSRRRHVHQCLGHGEIRVPVPA